MEVLDGFLLWAGYVSLVVVSLAIAVAFVRLVRGPSLPDRVIAVDLVAHLTIGFLGAYAILIQEETYIDVALVLALLAFMGTIAFARYIERIHADDEVTEL